MDHDWNNKPRNTNIERVAIQFIVDFAMSSIESGVMDSKDLISTENLSLSLRSTGARKVTFEFYMITIR